MKTNKLLLMTFLGLGCLCSTGAFSQPTDPKSNKVVKKTFTYEVNAQTSLDELKEIETMLNERYNINAEFTDVSIQNSLIQSVRVEIKNKNQQLSRSIRQNTGAIAPFEIAVTENNGFYSVSINNVKGSDSGMNMFSFSDLINSPFEAGDTEAISPLQNLNNGFGSDVFESFTTGFGDVFNQMNQMQEEMTEMFKKLENDPEVKKKTFTDENGNTTTILSKSSSSSDSRMSK